MIDKNSEEWKTIKIKADLLCLGLSPTRDARRFYISQNPHGDWKTGNVGLHILLNGQTYVLVTITHRFDTASPYAVQFKDNRWMLLRKSRKVATIEMVPPPDWYHFQTSTGKKASTIFLHEGSSFLHMDYVGCDLFRIGKPCKFCGTGGTWHVGSPEEIGEVVEAALRESNNYQVCLGGGTRLPLSKDTDYFTKCLIEIRKRVPDVPIFVEMVPPDTNEQIEKLVNAGATSFGFNLEIWDDKLRQEICPGKATISKRRYLGAMKYALKLIGPNKVGSCLIVGLEPIESSIEGARTLASEGIQPCMLIFKPWDRSVFRNRERCNPKDVLQVGEEVAQAMLEYAIDPRQNHGCLKCEACTVEHDIMELIRKD
jgi:hypothetical protein